MTENCFQGAAYVRVDSQRRINVPRCFRLTIPYYLVSFVPHGDPNLRQLALCQEQFLRKYEDKDEIDLQIVKEYLTLRPEIPASIGMKFDLKPNSGGWLNGAGEYVEIWSSDSWNHMMQEFSIDPIDWSDSAREKEDFATSNNEGGLEEVMNIISYAGSIAYSECRFPSVVNRFAYVQQGQYLIDLQSPSGEEDFYRFLGVAEKTKEKNTRYRTPWVFLMDRGGDYRSDEASACIEFDEVLLTETEIVIEGCWINGQSNKPYSFRSVLTRCTG